MPERQSWKGTPNHCAESCHLIDEDTEVRRQGGKEGVQKSKGSRTVGSDELVRWNQVDLGQTT